MSVTLGPVSLWIPTLKASNMVRDPEIPADNTLIKWDRLNLFDAFSVAFEWERHTQGCTRCRSLTLGYIVGRRWRRELTASISCLTKPCKSLIIKLPGLPDLNLN